MQRRRPGALGAAGGDRLVRPDSRRLVEHPGPGGIAHVGAAIAAQRKAKIVLRRQNALDPAPVVRFMLLQPQELRTGETGHRLHPDDSRQSGMIVRQFRGLRDRASVIVQDRRADRPIEPVEHDGAVHLAGKADRLQRAERLAGRPVQVGDRAGHGGAPDIRVLFRPAWLGTVGRIGARGARDRRAAVVRQQGFESRCSAVEPEIHGRSACAAPGARTRARQAQLRHASPQESDGRGGIQPSRGCLPSSISSRPRSRM